MSVLLCILVFAVPTTPQELNGMLTDALHAGWVQQALETPKPAQHWHSQVSGAPLATRVTSIALKHKRAMQLGSEKMFPRLKLEVWEFADDAQADRAQRAVSEAAGFPLQKGPFVAWTKGARVLVVSSDALLFEAQVKQLAARSACRWRTPELALTPDAKHYVVETQSVDGSTELAELSSGTPVRVNQSACEHRSVNIMFFVELAKGEALDRSKRLLTELAPLNRTIPSLQIFADKLSAIDTDIVLDKGHTFRVSYDDRGARPALTVSVVDLR